MNGMRVTVATALALALFGTPAVAHFLWVVPQPGADKAHVIVSESLAADARVDIAIVSGARLTWRDASGKESPVTLTRAGYVQQLPLAGAGVIYGHADLGVRPTREHAYRLHYYPKTIVGDAFARQVVTGGMPIEIVPTGAPGAVRLKVLVGGKAATNVDINLLLPDGTEDTVQTGGDGLTETLTGRGRYGAWARHWEQVSGKHAGQAFDHTRHYTMLVFDAGVAPGPAPAPLIKQATTVAKLPEAASSFGAVADDGWLYVYGGHIVPTHSYSTAAVSGRFHRLKLADAIWETLPDGPKAQGMNLALHNGKVYRVGGMQPQNAPGEPVDNQSLAEVARFDPATKGWSVMAPLPAPRSSHDVAVVGDRLFVIGGWHMKGKGQETVWPQTLEVMDLSAATPSWRSVPQPFKRRAFIAAADTTNIYVIGGFDDRSQVIRGVSIYNVASGQWSEGPALPGGMLNGFGAAAVTVEGRLFVSIDSGGLYRLNDTQSDWDKVGQATPRIVHRLVADGKKVFVVGGAGDDENSDLVEMLEVTP